MEGFGHVVALILAVAMTVGTVVWGTLDRVERAGCGGCVPQELTHQCEVVGRDHLCQPHTARYDGEHRCRCTMAGGGTLTYFNSWEG